MEQEQGHEYGREGAGIDKDNGETDIAGLTTVVQDGGNKTKNK